MKLAYPLKVIRITQKFGVNPDSYAQDGLMGHNGVDFGCPVGTELLASESGVIIEVGDQGRAGYGKFFRIKTDNLLQLTYGHCSLVKVKNGQRVTKGEVVALSGNTGRSTGPHLHFGVREYAKDGTTIKSYANGFKGAIDPLPFFMNEEPQVQLNDKQKEAVLFVGQNHIASNLDPSIYFEPVNRIDTFVMLHSLYKLLNK